ncbi:MAG: GspE/PulE family protein [Clostridium sp.]|nr:GspE/PulE family protein [Bacteroides sp.]MCM1198668.1 GspE/PulE family protein [Clostridium sp.]
MDIPEISTEALQVFTGDEAFHYRLLPCTIDSDGRLSCLGDAGYDYGAAIEEIDIIYGYKVSVSCVVPDELTRLLSIHYRQSGAVGQENALLHGQDIAANLIAEAWSLNASDIHIEPSETKCRVRFRIDGRLIERHVMNAAEYPGLVNRIKILSNLDISEKRLPQDGRIMYSRDDMKLDIRTSVMPTIYGEKIVLRLLARGGSHLSLEQLGLSRRQYDDYIASISRPHGLILISGPTGAGKSTTLYATLERLNRGDNNILTIEDPVEYTLDGVNQVHLREDVGLTFPVALRTFLRQDPDIIMLGEIRDEDTAEMAIRSSLTGHLLLSTLHTNSAWGCISRLVDMGIHPYLLSETLVACVAQRLVRLLCPHCKSPVEYDGQVPGFDTVANSGKFYGRTGCPACHFTGYHGRKAIYEVLRMDKDLSLAVRDNLADAGDLLSAKGISTLRDSALSLFADGETSLEEILPLLDSNA